MAVQDGEALALEGVPDINGVVVVSCEQEAPTDGEIDRIDAEDDAFLGVHGDLSVCAEVKEPTRGIIRPSGNSVP